MLLQFFPLDESGFGQSGFPYSFLRISPCQLFCTVSRMTQKDSNRSWSLFASLSPPPVGSALIVPELLLDNFLINLILIFLMAKSSNMLYNRFKDFFE